MQSLFADGSWRDHMATHVTVPVRRMHNGDALLLTLVNEQTEDFHISYSWEPTGDDPLPLLDSRTAFLVSIHIMQQMFTRILYPDESKEWINELKLFAGLDVALAGTRYVDWYSGRQVQAILSAVMLEQDPVKETRDQVSDIMTEDIAFDRCHREFHALVGMLAAGVNRDLVRLVACQVYKIIE